MTFDLNPEQHALVARTREVSAAIQQVASTIDASGTVQPELISALESRSLRDVFAQGAVAAVAILEHIATASAGFAATIGFDAVVGGGERPTAVPVARPGLRGSESSLAAALKAGPAALDRARLVAAATALGVGRAAVNHAVVAMKHANVKPGADETAPHWVLADGATDVEAARLVVFEAAQKLDLGEGGSTINRAMTFAAEAARRAVDAAIRVEGGDGYTRGGLLERLSRDARTLQVILG